MEKTMRAVVLDEPGTVDHLQLRVLPVPDPSPGWVRIAVKSFGLNRSELHTRLGLARGVTFPRVLGIEAAGIVDADPDGVLTPGQQVVTMMGGMGRTFDGGYAEYTVVPRSQVIPFHSDVPWETIGAVPETLQTAYGSLTTGLDLQAGQSLLIRGGTSALGLAATALAKDMGATVLATTRNPDRVTALADHGVDHPLVDDGAVAAKVRAIVPEGVDTALELVGTPTLPDTLGATRVHGTVCFTGMLSNHWTVQDFYPIDYLPRGVRLTAYAGEAGDLPAEVLQRCLDRIGAGRLSLGPVHVYRLDQIRDAHQDLEQGRRAGKLVVLVSGP
ncbi:zinc-binding dehydrogenase [Streptomyces albipurpureus]|uniref:Zinc-binding dehydrogenase n=1 Tax=Streptomyces albipurpureus TaxID=2897419 RepID=A0ABT0UNL9_9ACTN|nr:zinc-binding dehydrogenase [Streptomyces sp. CWNU-1]MCM2389826.1 zinc-binding dehydrogenase [Streptomyces sp. CWNU-1]